MQQALIGCVTILGLTLLLAVPTQASEDAILNAFRSGAVKLSAEVPVPPVEGAAPSLGGGQSINPLVNITKEEESLIVDKLFPLAMAKWPFNLTYVCWQNPTAENSEARQWVHDAVMNSWSKNADIRFLGWQECGPNTTGIRILVNEERPHVKALGKFLDGMKDGMVLNFTFTSWTPACQSMKEFCIKAIAIHQFGHALGFAHEQNLSNGELSELDIKRAQMFYGLPH